MSYRESLKVIESKMQYLVGNDLLKHFENVDNGLSKLEEMKKFIRIMSTRFFRPYCFMMIYTYENYLRMCKYYDIADGCVASEEEFYFVREVVSNE